MDIIQICTTVGAIFGVLPWICAILQKLVDYWTRGDSFTVVNIGILLSTFGKYRRFEEDYRSGDDTAIIFMTATVFGLFLSYTLLGMMLGCLIDSGYLWRTLISVAGVIAIIILPRLFLDAGKALKYNSKTGNAERIDKLEAELAELKRR